MTPATTHDHDVQSSEMQAALAARLARLRALFENRGIDAMLVSGEYDLRYLTGFVGHDSELLVTPDCAYIISDARYDSALDPWRSVEMYEVVMGERHRLDQSVRQLTGDAKITRLGIQIDRISVVAYRARLDALGEANIVDAPDMVAPLRRIKDHVEIAKIERAIRVHREALDVTLAQVHIGMTESELYARLDYEMKTRGASRPSFDGIVGAGPNSALPHHETGEALITEGILLIDAGALVDGYCSDITRTFGVTSLDDEIRRIYDIVLEAQIAAIEFAKPGVTCADTDRAAREVIERAGYGDRFGHGLGHGMGMEVHEPPYFNALETETRLEPGMVMTFEPGIYIPGVGGIRIEDDVLITETGTRILNDHPKSLDEAIISPDDGR